MIEKLTTNELFIGKALTFYSNVSHTFDERFWVGYLIDKHTYKWIYTRTTSSTNFIFKYFAYFGVKIWNSLYDGLTNGKWRNQSSKVLFWYGGVCCMRFLCYAERRKHIEDEERLGLLIKCWRPLSIWAWRTPLRAMQLVAINVNKTIKQMNWLLYCIVLCWCFTLEERKWERVIDEYWASMKMAFFYSRASTLYTSQAPTNEELRMITCLWAEWK
jgi:hypothetical protein